MREDIISFLENEIQRRCESPSNFFGDGIFYHIKSVVKNAMYLAKKYGGDMEVVVIAAWLHDIASITSYEYYKEHHIYGAKIAEDILVSFNYDNEKLALVQKCILNHRGSEIKEKESVEELCIADADAISHFDAIPSLFYLAYVKRMLSIEEGLIFVINKLDRSYKKLSSESKKLYEEKYIEALRLLH